MVQKLNSKPVFMNKFKTGKTMDPIAVEKYAAGKYEIFKEMLGLTDAPDLQIFIESIASGGGKENAVATFSYTSKESDVRVIYAILLDQEEVNGFGPKLPPEHVMLCGFERSVGRNLNTFSWLENDSGNKEIEHILDIQQKIDKQITLGKLNLSQRVTMVRGDDKCRIFFSNSSTWLDSLKEYTSMSFDISNEAYEILLAAR